MEKRTYPLRHAIPGTETVVTAFHFCPAQSSRKIYIQASLHADELPGSLVAHHLFGRLERLEVQGRLQAQIVLVPMCNPLGLRQNLFYGHIGRFDFATGQNYNRLRSIRLFDWALERLLEQGFVPGDDAASNVRAIRAALAQAIAAFEPQTSVDALQAVLVGLAVDADLVLDLHCDNHAVLHLYTLPQLWQVFEPMARHLGSECQILAEDSQSGRLTNHCPPRGSGCSATGRRQPFRSRATARRWSCAANATCPMSGRSRMPMPCCNTCTSGAMCNYPKRRCARPRNWRGRRIRCRACST